MKRKTYTYQRDKTQDFADIAVGADKPLPSDFDFLHAKRPLWRLVAWLFYNTLAVPILWLYSKIVYHTKIVNRKYVRKQMKGTGYFIYSNHTMTADGWNHQAFTCFPRRAFIVSLASTIMHSKLLGNVTMMLGAIPLPSDLKSAKNFLKAVKYHLEKQKAAIVIYPEGTIWPYYTHQRPVKTGSFKYPRAFNKPVVFACTTFRQPKGPLKKWLKPRVVIYLSDPIFPSRNSVEKIDENRLQQLYTEFIEKMSSIPENYAANDYQESKQADYDFMNQHTDEAIDSFLSEDEIKKAESPEPEEAPSEPAKKN
jgi:1-acyl-sn-glycerol-3-phosphate acyltransferase